MRVTTGMSRNQMLINIGRNARTNNDLYNQYASGKKIQVASENPIIASRALRFRTNVSETKQYERNVGQAMAWTEVTSQSFMNITEVSKLLKEKIAQGTNDTLSVDDRQKIISDIASLTEQIGLEMNASYAGRYVFSGYRTDQPPTFPKASSAEYTIEQSYNINDLQSTKSYQKTDAAEPAEMRDVDILKMPYTNVENLSITDSSGNPVTVTTKSIGTAGAYKVADDEINYIPETGELVVGKNVRKTLEDGDFKLSYDKKGFAAGELNPRVYYKCTDIEPGSKTLGVTYDMIGQDVMEYEIGVGSRMRVNSLAKDVYTDKIYSDLMNFNQTLKSLEVSSETSVRRKFEAAGLTGEELDKAVEDQLQLENQQLNAIAHDRFSDMLEIIDKFKSDASVRETDLGSRMSRLELTQTRLGDSVVTYETLMNDNEGVDLAEVTMNLSAAQSVYNASLKIGAQVIQMSLVDYI